MPIPIQAGGGIPGFSGSRQAIGPSIHEFDFSAMPIVSTALENVLAPTSQTTINDTIYDIYSGDVINTSGHVAFNQTINLTNIFSGVTYTSLDPTIGTVDSNGIVTRVGDGNCRVFVQWGNLSRIVIIPCSLTTPATSNIFNSWVTGSLVKHVYNQIDTLVAAASPNSYVIFDPSYMGVQGNHTRLSTCWAFPVDLTWMTTHRSNYGTYESGTEGKATLALITTKHVIGINHNMPPINGSVNVDFISADGTRVTRTLVSSVFYPIIGNTADGLTVATLDSDVPNTILDGVTTSAKSINPCKVMPSGWMNYFGSVYWPGKKTTDYFPVPMFGTNQFKEARIGRLSYIPNTYPSQLGFSFGYLAATAAENVVSPSYGGMGGDSGSPVGFIINGAFVYAGTIEGINIASYAGDSSTPGTINYDLHSHLDSAGHPYALSAVDLSAFPTY